MEIILNNKMIKEPFYLPQIARKNDVAKILDTIIHLEKAGRKKILPNIRGMLMEADSTHDIMDKHLKLTYQSQLFERIKGSQFLSFYNYLKDYEMHFFIDPNLDRLDLRPIYQRRFVSLGTEFFTQKLLDLLKNGDVPSSDKLDNMDFVRRVLEFQIKYKASVLIAPYTAVDIGSVDDDTRINLSMYSAAVDITYKLLKKRYPSPPIPVISIKKNMLIAKDNKGKVAKWDSLLELLEDMQSSVTNTFGQGLTFPFIFLKISNFNTLSKDENYENILKFFRYMQSFKKPILFLNMNEFAYMLFGEGLVGYSTRMSRGGMDIPAGRNLPEEARTVFGKYYVPRKMALVLKDKLHKLPCNCLFCAPYKKTLVKNMKNVEEWNSLRIYHYLWIKNEELKEIINEMKKSSLRAALQSMFADSNWKNFLDYI